MINGLIKMGLTPSIVNKYFIGSLKEVMRREGKKSLNQLQVNLINQYIDEDYYQDQMEEIFVGILRDIPPEHYANRRYSAINIKLLRKMVERGKDVTKLTALDVSDFTCIGYKKKYSNAVFNMFIRKTDIFDKMIKYTMPEHDAHQADEILSAIKQDLPVHLLSECSFSDMKRKRVYLLQHKDDVFVQELIREGYSIEQIKELKLTAKNFNINLVRNKNNSPGAIALLRHLMADDEMHFVESVAGKGFNEHQLKIIFKHYDTHSTWQAMFYQPIMDASIHEVNMKFMMAYKANHELFSQFDSTESFTEKKLEFISEIMRYFDASVIANNEIGCDELSLLKHYYETGVNMTHLINDVYDESQLSALADGIRDGLDVVPYADASFDSEAIRTLNRLNGEGVDIISHLRATAEAPVGGE